MKSPEQPPRRTSMETWFWVFSWFLCILTMTRNGFVIFLVCNKRQLRTKSNTFIVSLVVADFCHGMIPSEFLCDAMNESSSVKKSNLIITYIWVFILHASGTNLITLVSERYIVVVKPLKYLTFMKRHLVNQMVLISWGIHFLFNLIVLFWGKLVRNFIILPYVYASCRSQEKI